MDDGGVDAERDVVDEHPPIDRCVVHASLARVTKRAHRLAGIVAVEPEIHGEVVACASTDTHERNVPCSTATAATTACEPSPPATPRQSAPCSTASRANVSRSRPLSNIIVSTPSSAASSINPNRSTVPPPDRGLHNRTGRRGGPSGRLPGSAPSRSCSQRRASAGHRDSEQHENDGEPDGDSIRGTDCPYDGDGEHDHSDDNTDSSDRPAQRVLRDDPPAPGDGEHQPDNADEELTEVPEQRPTTNPTSAPVPTSAASAARRLRRGTLTRPAVMSLDRGCRRVRSRRWDRSDRGPVSRTARSAARVPAAGSAARRTPCARLRR